MEYSHLKMLHALVAAKKSKGQDEYVVCNADEGGPGAFMDRGVLEGERGMPRLKPPFPAQSGYFAKPTNINFEGKGIKVI